jgi:hypothetical protein
MDPNETHEVSQTTRLKLPKSFIAETQAGPPVQADLPREVFLDIGIGADRVRMPLNFQSMQLSVGRGGKEAPMDIDLGKHGGLEYGVSRRHATFLRRSDGIYIEDMGSTNGTRINGFALNTNRAYRLRNGDELEFGTFRTVIRFVK